MEDKRTRRPPKAQTRPRPAGAPKTAPKAKPEEARKTEAVPRGKGAQERPPRPAPRSEEAEGEPVKKQQKWAKHGQKLWKRIRKEYKARKEARKLKESERSREARHADEMQATLFLRNVPLAATEEDLADTFSKYGTLRYAKIVRDKDTGLSKGTAFLCFSERAGAEEMMAEAYPPYWDAGARGESCLTLMGRQLSVAWALKKDEAERAAQKTASEKRRESKKVDRRNMGLANVGYELSHEAMQAAGFTKLDIERREAALNEKLAKLKNPNMFVSQTRLSVRYLPRGVDEKMLKIIAREAAFAGLQHPHQERDDDDDDENESEDEDESDVEDESENESEKDEDEKEDEKEDEDEEENEEEEEDEDEDEEEEEEEKKPKKTPEKKVRVVLKQVKVVKEKGRLDPTTNQARLKSFGFIEFQTHSMALAAQQMMNNRADLFVPLLETKFPEGSGESFKSRILVDFAVENIFALQKLQFAPTHPPNHNTTVLFFTHAMRHVHTTGGPSSVARTPRSAHARQSSAALAPQPSAASPAPRSASSHTTRRRRGAHSCSSRVCSAATALRLPRRLPTGLQAGGRVVQGVLPGSETHKAHLHLPSVLCARTHTLVDNKHTNTNAHLFFCCRFLVMRRTGHHLVWLWELLEAIMFSCFFFW